MFKGVRPLTFGSSYTYPLTSVDAAGYKRIKVQRVQIDNDYDTEIGSSCSSYGNTINLCTIDPILQWPV